MERAAVDLIQDLYRQELERLSSPHHLAYVRQHAQPNSVARQVSTFERYRPYLPDRGTILDWGCCHAPDSCLIRNAFGDRVELHGCDFDPPGAFPVFHGFAGLEYRRLVDPLAIPYEDGSLDAVVGSGVLEHTAIDSESLKELHRTLRNDGVLIITFLPNRLSWTEAALRLGGGPAHQRPYGLREARRLLLHHGFLPVRWGYHQVIPAHRLQRLFRHAWRLNAPLERAWPVRLLATNIWLVARRQPGML